MMVVNADKRLTDSHVISGSRGGVACFSMFLKAASFLFIFLASSFSRSLSRASAFSSNYKQQGCKQGYKIKTHNENINATCI